MDFQGFSFAPASPFLEDQVGPGQIWVQHSEQYIGLADLILLSEPNRPQLRRGLLTAPGISTHYRSLLYLLVANPQ